MNGFSIQFPSLSHSQCFCVTFITFLSNIEQNFRQICSTAVNNKNDLESKILRKSNELMKFIIDNNDKQQQKKNSMKFPQ